MATVRAKALASLATIFQQVDKSETLQKEIKACFSPPEEGNARGTLDKSELLLLLRRRITDEKSGVRRAALQVLEIFGQFAELEEQDLCLLLERCMDSAVSIRKQAINSLTRLLTAQPNNKPLCTAWLHGVLPQITDPESSVQEKVLDYFDEIILKPVSATVTKYI